MNPYDLLFRAMWSCWGVYWLVSAVGNKRIAKRESALSRLMHLGPLVVAFVLVASPRLSLSLLSQRFLPEAQWRVWFWLGALITAAGLLLAVWARVHLGRNWSASVTVKEQHEHITSGPYGLVRHPIYAGLLLGFLGTALAIGEWRGLLALFIVFASLWPKLRREERFMDEQFGDAYASYKRRVSALIPFVF